MIHPLSSVVVYNLFMADIDIKTQVIVKINEPVLNALKRSPNGATYRFLKVLGEAGKKEAVAMSKRRLSPVGGSRATAGTYEGQARDWHRPGNKGPGRPPGRTGEYETNFHYRITPYKDSLQLRLYNDSFVLDGRGKRFYYALVVERGSGPAEISHRDGGRLNYFSERVGDYVFSAPGESVYHPGAFSTHTTNNRVKRKGAFILTDTLRFMNRLSTQYRYLGVV
jgi:hypothetical protein